MKGPLLEIKGLNKSFGRVIAASDINLTYESGIITSIIGPNGAGKSTFINMISGFLPPDSGKVIFQGKDITQLPIHHRVRMGLCRSFQVVDVFPELTVFENVEIPVLAVQRKAWRMFTLVRRERDVHREVLDILEKVGLGEKFHLPASALSHGDQRILEVGIALAARPKLLFLDEPTAGMNPVERQMILQNIKRLSSEGETTFVIVEHDMDIVFSLSDRVIVLHHGEVICDGSPEVVKSDARVCEVYLGEEVVS